jgi:hypothetical protein
MPTINLRERNLVYRAVSPNNIPLNSNKWYGDRRYTSGPTRLDPHNRGEQQSGTVSLASIQTNYSTRVYRKRNRTADKLELGGADKLDR